MPESRDLETFEEKLKNERNQSVESRLMRKGYSRQTMLRYLWSEIKYLMHNFCATTSMHGFQHIIAPRLRFIEKLIWAIICLTAISFCLVLMYVSYQSTKDRLMFIQLIDRDSPLHTLDFPAVTICNLNKVYKPKAEIMRKKLLGAGYNNSEITLFFRNLPQLIQSKPNLKKKDMDYIMFNKMLYTLTNNLKIFMEQLMQPCNKLLKSCTWMGKSYNCSKLFKIVDSLNGPCCGFNYHVSKTFADRNYSPQCRKFYNKYDLHRNTQCTNISECPGWNNVLKTPGTGTNAGLTVELNIEPALYLGSIRNYVAAFVIIHESRDFPETDILTATAQPDHEVNIVLSGTEIRALNELKTLTQDQRKCVFRDEIAYDYSYQSCIAGCKLRRIITACDCVPYYYPKNCINISGTCDFKSINCLRKYQYQITRLYEKKTLDNGKTLEICQCQKSCNKTFYTMSLDKNDRYSSKNNLPVLANSNSSILNVFFRNYGYVKYEMSLFLSWNDLIASLGGIIALCLGGSFISVMEPVIYLLLTPFRRAHHRKIRREKEEAKAKKRAEEESKEQFKDCQNNISTVRDNFTISAYLRTNCVKSRNGKNLNSENFNLYRTHFM